MRLVLALALFFFCLASAQVTYDKVATVLSNPAFDLLEEAYDSAVQAVTSYSFILTNMESQISYYQGLLDSANSTMASTYDSMVTEFVTAYNQLPAAHILHQKKVFIPKLTSEDKALEQCLKEVTTLRNLRQEEQKFFTEHPRGLKVRMA